MPEAICGVMTYQFLTLIHSWLKLAKYLDDAAFSELQSELMRNPEAGDVIAGTGGLRKMPFMDKRRGKGKRGGLRVIFYWWGAGMQFWLFSAR